MRRWRKVLISTLLGLAVLELVLQLGAAIAFWTAAAPPAGDLGAGPVILCVGDSYTYGLGASGTAHSYPAVMEARLRQQRPDLRVANVGWPGRNSREALLLLERQLQQYRPRLVFVLIGLNDTWTKPELVDPAAVTAAGRDGWRWRWRTLRLLQVLFGGADQERGAAAQQPGVPAAAPAGARPPGQGMLDAAIAKMKAGDGKGAIGLLEQAEAADPANAPEYCQGLVQFHMALGQREAAMAALQRIETEWRAHDSAKVTEAYAVALAAAGERQRATEVARAGTQRHPRCSSLWWLLGQGLYDAGDLAGAEQALDAGLECAQPDDTAWRASLLRDGARACCRRDLCKAVRHLVAAMVLDGDVERCRVVVGGAQDAFSSAAVNACLAAQPLSPRQQELAQRLFAVESPGRANQCRILAAHLRAMIARCRAHGAEPVLLTYPLAVPDIEAVQQAAAREAGLELVRTLPAFADEQRRRPASELYIADRHCSDAGYELMGRLAAAAAERLLGR